jgi:hypothetical protein
VTVFLTSLGLMLVVSGVCCGFAAYRRTLAKYDGRPVWPWASQKGIQVIAGARRVFRRRPRVSRAVTGTVSVGLGATAATRGIRSGLPVPTDVPMEEQIRILVRRIEHVEAEAAKDRMQHCEEISRLQSGHSAQAAHLGKADDDLKFMATDIAVGVVRLQITGLMLVGVGTVIMALPTLLSL